MKNILLVLICIVSANEVYSQRLSELNDDQKRKVFLTATELKINDLENHIKTLTNKSIDRDIRAATVDSAVKYFIDETKLFEVSSKNSTSVRSFPVRKYLWNLMVLNYSKIEIEWVESEWITNFRQAPDGKYYGVVRIYQTFSGYGLDRDLPIYTDVTSKDIEVELNVVKLDTGDDFKEIPMIRLGDVRVVETR